MYDNYRCVSRAPNHLGASAKCKEIFTRKFIGMFYQMKKS